MSPRLRWVHLICVLPLFLLVSSCSESESPASPSSAPGLQNNDATWSLLNTSRTIVDIQDDGDELVVLTDGGAILRGDATHWTGDYVRGHGAQGLWLSEDGRMVAVGGRAFLQFDGTTWDARQIPLPVDLHAVWGTSCDDLFAVGNVTNYEDYIWGIPLAILHYDGSGWTMAGPEVVAGPPTLLSIWGTAHDDIFTVGEFGTIYHYDGVEWASMQSATTKNLHSVWGRASNDVFAVGQDGTILHYDGREWSLSEYVTTRNLHDVSGSEDGTVFIVGEGGTILQLGDTWEAIASNTTLNLYRVLVRNSADVYVGGVLGSIHHYAGDEWKLVWGGVNGRTLRGVWASSSSDIFGVGEWGNIIHFDGDRWTEMESGTQVSLLSAWGSSDHDVFVGGYTSTMLHFDGTSWEPMTMVPRADIHQLFGFSSTSVFAAGEGAFLVYDGTEWKEGPPTGTYFVDALWGSSPTSIFAAGNYGFIAHYDGTAWARMDSHTNGHIGALWGTSDSDVTAFGSADVIHFDGHEWRVVASAREFYQYAWGISSTNILAAASDNVFRFDGRALNVSRSVSPRIEAMWGTKEHEVIGVGYDGMVIRYGPVRQLGQSSIR